MELVGLEKSVECGKVVRPRATDEKNLKKLKGSTLYFESLRWTISKAMSRISWEFERQETYGSESEAEASELAGAENDELYDPDADNIEETWVRENLLQTEKDRRNGQEHKNEGEEHATGGNANRAMDLGDREFQLCCPCCFTLLCLQCQQHVKYKSQFRAIFVMNCTVKKSGSLRVRVHEDESGSRTVRNHSGTQKPAEKYYPVACSTCGTDVGVLDQDEVYHFCNVMY
mmetsp:Transcript_21644/g.88290  ORF Transcript_21644/g.88290 Transcript_21644/m.88290 type:complete len:230 (-) Transcript_21644:2696-3385(-)